MLRRMAATAKGQRGIVLVRPGTRDVRLDHLVLDFNGTIAGGGKLLPGVASRLRALARRLEVVVLTADTFGTARPALAKLPVAVVAARDGRDKKRFVAALDGAAVAVGNGVNDAAMFRQAALSIAIIGPEGAAGTAVAAATIVVRDVRDALDLLLDPRRLTATLRA